MPSLLAVDFRWMHGQVRGMGRYAQELLVPVADQVTALLPSGSEVSVKNIARGWSFFPWWEQYVLPRLAEQEKFKLLLCPYNTAPLTLSSSCQLVLIVHDLIYLKSWLELPPSTSLYQTLGRIYRRWVVPRVIARANYLLTVSEFTKQELVTEFGISPAKIVVVPNSLSDDWLDSSGGIQLREDYIFTVAGQAPSKNVARLLRAFALLEVRTGQQCKLVIAGIAPSHQKHFVSLANRLKIESRVIFLGYISEAEMRRHYARCKMFVFSSLFEGFGIPLLEAMASGAPIACSNTTSMPEVVLDSAIMFDPRSIKEMSKAMLMLFEDNNLREDYAARGRARVKRYLSSNVREEINAFWGSIGAI